MKVHISARQGGMIFSTGVIEDNIMAQKRVEARARMEAGINPIFLADSTEEVSVINIDKVESGEALEELVYTVVVSS